MNSGALIAEVVCETPSEVGTYEILRINKFGIVQLPFFIRFFSFPNPNSLSILPASINATASVVGILIKKSIKDYFQTMDVRSRLHAINRERD